MKSTAWVLGLLIQFAVLGPAAPVGGQKALRQAETSIAIEHGRASKLLEKVEPLISGNQSLSVRADDRRGELLVKGTAADVEQLRSYVRFFDVSPRRLSVEILVDSPADHAVRKTTTEICNNVTWSFKDAGLDVGLEITPRINDDGTVTVRVVSTFGSNRVDVVHRTRLGSRVYLRPGSAVALDENTKSAVTAVGKKIIELDEKGVPAVRLVLRNAGR